MYCRKCRNEINENDVFCPKCGTKVELKEKPYKFKKVFTIIVLSIIVIIAVVGFIFYNKKIIKIKTLTNLLIMSMIKKLIV